MASAAASTKAFLQDLDGGSVFHFQFNPKEFKVNDKANWKASEAQVGSTPPSGEAPAGSAPPLLTYEKGDPSTVSFDIIFDTTDSESGDVYKEYVEPLRGFLHAKVREEDAQGNKLVRPPYCVFVWGSFTFNCVVESLNSTAIMFNRAGKAIRAKVTLNLKERDLPVHNTKSTIQLSSKGFSSAAAGVRVSQIQPNQTLSSIAPGNWREVALANGIPDPMNPPVGAYVALSLTSDLAAVMASQFLGYTPNKWGGDLAIMDYGSTYAGPSAGGTALQSSVAAPADATMYSAADSGGKPASGPGAPAGSGPTGSGSAGSGSGSRPGSGRPRGRGRTAFDG